MLPPRRLWTGPPAAAIREHLLAELGSGPAGLWIVPTPLARDQLVRLLAISAARRPAGSCIGSSAGTTSGGWCVPAWRTARRWLSEPACRALFREAIDRAREAGEIEAIEASVRWPGYRRQAPRRIDEWTIAERPARGRTIPGRRRPGRGRRVGRLCPLSIAPGRAERRRRTPAWRSGPRGVWPGVPTLAVPGGRGSRRAEVIRLAARHVPRGRGVQDRSAEPRPPIPRTARSSSST